MKLGSDEKYEHYKARLEAILGNFYFLKAFIKNTRGSHERVRESRTR